MVLVIGPKESYDNPYKDVLTINTTSRSSDFGKGLSPFFLKPIGIDATNVENVWQYSKVYKEHLNKAGEPSKKYFEWRDAGFKNWRAVRYPMGKGVKSEYSYWNGEKLGYIEARKKIYIPVYSAAVIRSEAYNTLYNLYKEVKTICLWDFDGYDYYSMMLKLEKTIEVESRSMGHAFVIAMLLEKNVKPIKNNL
jgi:hypothetical protein